MDISSDEVLNSWLRLTTAIGNLRITSALPYNELLIGAPEFLTATDLCRATGMLKSQMNRTLNSMEKKGLISRTRSGQDRRQVYISFNMEQAEFYERQHEKVLFCVDTLLEKVGRNRAEEIVKLFTLISDMADEVTG